MKLIGLYVFALFAFCGIFQFVMFAADATKRERIANCKFFKNCKE